MALQKNRPRPGDAMPAAGDVVHVRHRQYLVEAVSAPTEITDQHTLVRMVCLDDDAQGRHLSVFWERELGARIAKPGMSGLGAPARLDPPRHFAAYLHALKWSSVTATDARLFQAPFRAGIHLLDHQLVPLQKALELPRVNLFIADDVGLGKTIEAGLVMQELVLRQRADLALVVCPASVTLQWRDEMAKRFGLRFEIYSRNFVARCRQQRGFQVNPWKTHNRFIVSYSLLRRSDAFEPLRAMLEERGHHRTLLVLDEAHNVAPASASRYAVDTETTRAIRALSERFEHRLFLSATPHNGHSNSFSALLEMLDPQRFTRGTRVREAQLAPVMVRRLKADLKAIGTSHRYPDRRVLAVQLTHAMGKWSARWPGAEPEDLGAAAPAELELATKLASYGKLFKPDRKRGKLVFINLQKRLLSSVEAFHRTLSMHARALGVGEWEREGDQDVLGDPLPEEYGPSEEELELGFEGEIAQATSELTASEQARILLEDMLKLAARHRNAPDAKVRALLGWIRAHQCSLGRGSEWSDLRVIVFTEYGDTLRYLREQLTAAFEGTDRGEERVLSFTGGMGDEARAELQRTFNSDPAEHPVRILLCTDAAREGINLQGRCADLFHFDVPWNPSRLEQRNGRIDRTLQREPEVRCGYFVYTQRPEDAVLDTLARKVEVIRRDLGSLGSVLMQRLESALASGIREETIAAIEQAGERRGDGTVQAELEGQRDLKQLRKQLDAVARIKEDSLEVMEFDPALLRDALDVGFELAGASKLAAAPLKVDGKQVEAWKVPDLPGSWERTLDSIRPPRERKEAPWDWRRRPLLPVVFEAPAQIESDVAHLHLSHPLVHRVLHRFLSQGFSANDLTRVTVVRSKRDAVARVIVFGRLSLFGAGATRLHDQLISVAARWLDGGGRGHLKPFGDDADRKAIEQLETTLAEAPELSELPASVQRRLVSSAANDFAALWPAVEEEAERRGEEAQKRLSSRGAAEAQMLREILRSQQELIEETLGAQLELQATSESGREQLEQWRRDKAHLEKRKLELVRELAEQPGRLEQGYEVQLRRLTEVGMVYLWPSSR